MTTKARTEPGPNAPCWCGSGKKYKKCHRNRGSEKPLPHEAIAIAMRAAWRHKQCLHPLAAPGICDRIVSAHSVQRSQTLEEIVDSGNHVCSFFPLEHESDGSLRLHRIGWREASTFTGFCAKHDSSTFEPLETAEFTATEEQCFLVGYRALCHEVYQKTGALRADSIIRQMVDRGLPLEMQMAAQESFSVGWHHRRTCRL